MGHSLHMQSDQGTICATISRELEQLHKQLTGLGLLCLAPWREPRSSLIKLSG